jgi:small subunit ribosomal protein S1
MSDDQQTQQGQDFGSILAEYEQGKPEAESREAPKVGDKIKGKILSIGPEAVFIDLGGKAEGSIELAQVTDAEGTVTVAVGDELDATVTAIDPESGAYVLRRKAARGPGDRRTEVEQAFRHAIPVEGVVTAVVKGGVEVQVYGMRAFCPVSQLDLRYVENPERFLEQRLTFRIARYEDQGKGRRPNIVLSRRALLEEEQKSKAAETRARLAPGAILRGKVTSLTDYGAFVDLGGLEGMLHVSEIGHARVANPKDVLEIGQEIDVQVLKIEPSRDPKKGGERISLSRKSLESDPWKEAANRFPEGARITGRVMRLETFGAFVEIAPGLEGLVHISELGGGRRIRHPREALQLGQDVEVTVLGVDLGKRRISLTTQEGREELEAAPERERAEGAGGSSSGSSSGATGTGFGSMADFFRVSQKKK